jgi:hypothetical protein
MLRKNAREGGLDGPLVDQFCTLISFQEKLTAHSAHPLALSYAQRHAIEELQSLA